MHLYPLVEWNNKNKTCCQRRILFIYRKSPELNVQESLSVTHVVLNNFYLLTKVTKFGLISRLLSCLILAY